MHRIWLVPEGDRKEVSDFYRAENWRALVWVYNHFGIGRNKICVCDGSFKLVQRVFEPYKDLYLDEAAN